jgi:small subunit ribosomal protein S20
MANTKSAIKAARKSLRLRDRNKTVKSRLKTLHRKYEELAKGSDAEATRVAVSAYISAVDKAVKSGVIHRNLANRTKARLSRYLATKK